MKTLLASAVCVAAVLWTWSAGAGDDIDASATTATADLPEIVDLRDLAFDHLVDLTLLGRAWDELDASLLTDSALQFVEAERVLYRQRKGISADQLLLLAIRVASETNDTQSLDRLAQVVPTRHNEELVTQLDQARKLAGVARDADSEMKIGVGDMTPRQFTRLQQCLSSVERYHITRDPEFLETWRDSEVDRWNLPEDEAEHLRRIMGTARSTEAVEPVADRVLLIALDRLGSAARPDTSGSESWIPTAPISENYGYDVTIQPDAGSSGGGFYGGVQINF